MPRPHNSGVSPELKIWLTIFSRKGLEISNDDLTASKQILSGPHDKLFLFFIFFIYFLMDYRLLQFF